MRRKAKLYVENLSVSTRATGQNLQPPQNWPRVQYFFLSRTFIWIEPKLGHPQQDDRGLVSRKQWTNLSDFNMSVFLRRITKRRHNPDRVTLHPKAAVSFHRKPWTVGDDTVFVKPPHKAGMWHRTGFYVEQFRARKLGQKFPVDPAYTGIVFSLPPQTRVCTSV